MIIRPSTKMIIQSSVLDLLRTNPQEKITVKQIAENCGISIRTFYNNFPDKNAVVNSIWEDAMSSILLRPLDEFYTYQLNYIITNADIFKNILSYTGQNSFYECCYNMERKKLMMHMNPEVLDSEELYQQFVIGVEYMIHGNLSVVNAWINTPNLAEKIKNINDSFGGLWERLQKSWPSVVVDNLSMEPLHAPKDYQFELKL